MRKFFNGFVILLLILPSLVIAEMSQAEIDKIYTKPIMLDAKHSTFNIELPVDSTDGYRWFLVAPDYDYIDDGGYTHKSVDTENSKWGGMDEFKLKLTKKFRKVPHKVVLHFECFRLFEKNGAVIKKNITILSIND
ncbi:MAG: putative secreted protein [Francisella sp.]|jgi:predicted secreted protein